jgi:hypothetical protein
VNLEVVHAGKERMILAILRIRRPGGVPHHIAAIRAAAPANPSHFVSSLEKWLA